MKASGGTSSPRITRATLSRKPFKDLVSSTSVLTVEKAINEMRSMLPNIGPEFGTKEIIQTMCQAKIPFQHGFGGGSCLETPLEAINSMLEDSSSTPESLQPCLPAAKILLNALASAPLDSIYEGTVVRTFRIPPENRKLFEKPAEHFAQGTTLWFPGFLEAKADQVDSARIAVCCCIVLDVLQFGEFTKHGLQCADPVSISEGQDPVLLLKIHKARGVRIDENGRPGPEGSRILVQAPSNFIARDSIVASNILIVIASMRPPATPYDNLSVYAPRNFKLPIGSPRGKRQLEGDDCSSAAPLTKALRMHPGSSESHLSFEENLALRKKHLAPSLRTHYSSSPSGPIQLQSGAGQFLYGTDGRRYLDCVNNVCHVGHCHPRVVEAATNQMKTLNTNTRYLHDNIVRLATRLSGTMPEPLTNVFFVNSGTEANDLALRLARNHTKRQQVYCVDGAYHGHSASTLAISPYSKYSCVEMPKGSTKLMQPDSYRLAKSDADIVDSAVKEFQGLLDGPGDDCEPAAFIVESIMCCGGVVMLPHRYLREMYSIVRSKGGLTIADEVQTGFGRVGDAFWALESQGVVPDIVTIGKPFGNGFPLAAVVTTAEIAASSQHFEYFNTFGGNPVACAVGLEVLNVVQDEELQHNASVSGSHALK
eukprot:gene1539-2819_t